MRKAIILSILTLGISSIISQLLIIRELIISFYGNEFFIGWILFSWLFWVGIGSLFLNKIISKNLSRILVYCHILIALFISLEIFLTRLSRTLIGGPTGQIPNLIPALLYSFFILAPLCLILGLQFAIVSRFWKSLIEKSNPVPQKTLWYGARLSQILGKSYILETLGFIIGGLAFSYVLIFINEFLIISILAWLNLLAAVFITFLIKKTNPFLKSLIIILIIAFIGISVFSKIINNQTNEFRFPNQKLIESKNSIYGNIAVTKLKEQYNFYESGLFLGTDKEEIFNEYLAHFSLLYHPNPKKILLIGGGFNGILTEILKHQPEEIFYLELDPTFIKTINKYIDLEEVKIINQDARYFLKNNLEKFDVIIINLPNPSTALINRLYTEDFLKETKHHLNQKGLLVTYLSLGPDYIGPEIENLDASLYKALKKNFDSIIILPEYNHFFISSQQELDYDSGVLIKRLKERNIETDFVNAAYIEYRLTNDRVQRMLSTLNKNQTAKINQDQFPISYYYNFVYWTSTFYPGLAKFFLSLIRIKFIWIVIFTILGLLMFLLKRFRKKQNLVPVIMATAGFTLMISELIIIFGFQIFYGYLYYKIALIITVLMAGMALGSWLGVKKINQSKIKTLIKVHGLIIIFCLALLLGFYFLFKVSPRPSIGIEIVFLLMAAIIGGIVGFEFPIINRLYLSQTKNTRLDSARQASRNAGTIYGADLIGSCLGAFLVSIFLIPIFGIFQTLILLIILNLVILIPLVYSRLTSQV
jgi:spermidine synthase